MKLKELIEGIDVIDIKGSRDIEISDIAINSKKVSLGSLYICLRGKSFDGHDFISEAESYGAKAVVCEKELLTSLTQIIVKDCRSVFTELCSAFYRHPEKKLNIIGITGTNGKTSTANMIYSIFNSVKVKCGLIGTLGVFYGTKKIDATLTTPDPLELFRHFKDMVNCGVKVVVMEVSAHALYFDKIYGLSFETTVFSNLTQDHLDFFNTMENYKKAKEKLFSKYKSKYQVINSDDEMGVELIKKSKNAITYGINNPADVFAMSVKEEKDGTFFILNMFDKIYEVKTKLRGLFNVYNLLAAATTVSLYGVKVDEVFNAIQQLKTVDGRIEQIYDGDFSVYIDYAHTPDGLEKVLKALKKNCIGNLICLFGCGGNRDKDKREIMGKISGELADFTVITSDNPRYEEPIQIIFDIEKGILNVTKKYVIIQDRREAIRYAISLARKDDVVLIAGKGSENYQEILGIKKPFNDKDTVYEVLEEQD